LIIDDEAVCLQTLEAVLKFSGYSLQAATSGEAALEKMNEARFSLIILDVMMPGLSGFDVCTRIKANPDWKSIPIIFLTALDDEATKMMGFEVGAVDFICKPFSVKEVRARVQTHLELRRLQISLETENLSLAAKLAQKALKESQEKFRHIFDNAMIGHVIINPDGTTQVNRIFAEMLGFPVEDLSAFSWKDFTHPDDFPRVQSMEAALHADKLHQAVQEIRLRHRNGDIIWTEISTSLQVGEDQAPLYALTSVRNISSRKAAEQEKESLQTQLYQAQKLDSVGRLAGGVAHDFNNLLGIILGNTELALDRIPPEDPVYVHLREIEGAAGQCADLARQLLTFAQKQVVHPKILDINEAIGDLLKMLQRLIGENIRLVWNPGSSDLQTKIDLGQFSQILTNLTVNARDAISGHGTITVTTSRTILDEAFCLTHVGFSPGEFVLIEITDTGCGIPPAILANIFEPFFTTKGIGRGAGLGLAATYGIIRQNHGFVKVDSVQHQGTTFSIYLPRISPSEGKAPQAEPSCTAAPRTETILLVEDNPGMLQLTGKMLENLGYHVLTASTPSEASRLAQESTHIHLLVTDVIMPEMNGPELSRHLRQQLPHLKILFMSGYTADAIEDPGFLNGNVGFIEKPFSLKHLAQKIREILHSSPS
jgi:PAS domain S-box-containing protein